MSVSSSWWRSPSRQSAALVAAAVALLTVAWCFAATPFSAPDETAHYVRAVGVGGGELVGEPIRWPQDGLTPPMHAWVQQTARAVRVPAGLAPRANCGHADLTRAPTCVADRQANPRPVTVGTSTGTYEPLPYVLPGLGMWLANDSLVALWLGRLVMALQALALVVPAVWLLGRHYGPGALAGMAAALTPMAVSLFASLNPSGTAVAAGVALVAGVAVLPRTGRAGWLLVAAAAFVLPVSRSSGIAWVVVILVLGAAWYGRRLPALVRRWRGPALAVLLAAAGGVVLNRAWAAWYGPSLTVATPTWYGIQRWYEVFGVSVFRQAIGWFGTFALVLPDPAYRAWGAVLAVVAVTGLAAARGLRRVVLVLAGGVLALAPALLFRTVVEPTGFGPQARHLLPVLVAVPVLAGVAVDHRRLRTPAWRWPAATLAAGVVVTVAVVQLTAWGKVAHRAATGAGGAWWFLTSSAWSPAGGWIPWAVAAGLGGLSLAAGGALAAVTAWTDRPRVGSPQGAAGRRERVA